MSLSGNILLTAATELELKETVRLLSGSSDLTTFNYGRMSIEPLITGIGMVHSSYSLTNRLKSGTKPDMVVNTGIAGSFRRDIPPGSVGYIIKDRFADFGIDNNGCFIDIFESGLMEQSEGAFEKGWVLAERELSDILQQEIMPLTAITVNTVSGSPERINMLKGKYNPDIETMESAVFLYICRLEKIPCMAVRSVSNFVEPRNRGNWEIPLALNSLAKNMGRIFKSLGNK